MTEFETGDNLKRIIQEEQEKHQVPFGYGGEINIKALQECVDPIKQQIDRIAEKVEYETSLYLICELAKKWVEQQRKPEVLYQAMIPLNPRTKKNNQQIIRNIKTGASMIVQNERYKQYEKDSGWFLKTKMEPIKEPVNVKCVFYRDSRRRVDLTNLLEAIDDILVKYKILSDDNFEVLVSHDGSKVLVDRDHPRTEIEITRIRNYNLNQEESNG